MVSTLVIGVICSEGIVRTCSALDCGVNRLAGHTLAVWCTPFLNNGASGEDWNLEP